MKNEDDKKTKQQIKNKQKKEATKNKKQQILTKDVENEEINEEDKFAEELYWCLQQIELGLKNRKPAPDQAIKSQKLLQQLKSTKTPKAKKRMLMKQNFGNYREKLAAQAKKQASPSRLVSVDEALMKKSVFIKKKLNDMPVVSASLKGEGFCFNFCDPMAEIN